MLRKTRKLAFYCRIVTYLVFILIPFTFALADEFPKKPIQLINPFSAGGSHDAHARAFSGVAHQYFGVPVLAVIKAGGAGTAAIQWQRRCLVKGKLLVQYRVCRLAAWLAHFDTPEEGVIF